MIKAILIDDEPIITEGLKILIDWKNLNVELLETFHSSIKALEYIKSNSPQIIITDICMPSIDGIELIRQVKNMNIRSKFIILSGYNEFQYAQQAINMGAECYLLKPTVKEQLEEAIFNACGKIQNEEMLIGLEQKYKKAYIEIEPFLKENFFNDLSRGRIKREEIAAKAEYLGIALYYTNYISAIIMIDCLENNQQFQGESGQQLLKFAVRNISEEILKEKQYGHVFNVDDFICILLNCNEKLLSNIEVFSILNEIKDIVEKNIHETLTIGIGNSYEEVYNFKISYKEALTALESRFIIGGNNLIHINNIIEKSDLFDESYPFDIQRAIINSIKMLNNAEAFRNIESISDIFVSISRGNEEKIKNLFVELVTIVLRELKEIGFDTFINEEKDNYIMEILQKDTYEELKAYVFYITDLIISNLSGNFKSREQNIIDTTKKYIDSHLAENISLKVLSSIVYMNPSYFSNFFKINTGKNISDYILEARMNKAVEYLLNSDVKVYELAEMVGYGDPRRFSNAFKKYFGMNPNEYKVKLKGS